MKLRTEHQIPMQRKLEINLNQSGLLVLGPTMRRHLLEITCLVIFLQFATISGQNTMNQISETKVNKTVPKVGPALYQYTSNPGDQDRWECYGRRESGFKSFPSTEKWNHQNLCLDLSNWRHLSG